MVESRLPATPPTAFVTGADHPAGLGSARALRAAGARVIGFARRRRAPTCRSRAWAEVRRTSSPCAMASAEELIEHAAREPGPVFLVPTEDDMVLALAHRRHRLPPNVRTCFPSAETVELLLEKTRFAAWAQERGYPVPRTVSVHSAADLREAVRDFPFPAILKPVTRTHEWGRFSRVEKVLYLSGPGDLAQVPFDLFAAAPSYVLSEWIEGEDSDVYFCLGYFDERSEMVAGFTGRKLLQWPRLTGSTAACVGVDAPDLRALTARLFKDAGCTGLASLEVKRSARDGRLLITEPTVGRPNLQSAAAHCSGSNLVGVALRHAMGRDHADLLKPPRRCLWVQEHGLLRVLRSRKGRPLPWRILLAETLRTRVYACTYLRRGDPGPLVSLVMGWTRDKLRRWTQRSAEGAVTPEPTAERAG